MKPRARRRAGRYRDPKVWIGLAVSAAALWYSFREVEPGPLFEIIFSVKVWLILAVMLQVEFMLFVRGHRWALFLKPVKRVPWIPLGWSVCIGFAINNLLPARVGEVARAISVSRKTGLGFGTVLGSVVVERVYDTLSVAILFAASLFLWDFSGPMDKLAAVAYEKQGWVISQDQAAVSMAILVGAVLVTVIFLKWKTELSLRLAGFFLRPFPARWREKVLTLMRNFIGGLTQTTNPLEVIWIVFMSAMLWIISLASVWIGLRACHVDAGVTESIFVLMSMVIAVSIPAAPGYVGPYHFLACQAILLTCNVDYNHAMGAAIVIHLANYLPQTASGLYALAREGLSLKEIEQEPAALRE